MEQSNQDRTRKRQLTLWWTFFAIPFALYFAIVDFNAHQTVELVIDLTIAAVLILCAFLLIKLQIDDVVGHIELFLINAVMLYAVAIGGGGGGAWFWLFILPPMIFFFLERNEGIIWVVVLLFIATILIMKPQWLGTYEYPPEHHVEFMVTLIWSSAISLGIESSRHRFSKLLMLERDQVLEEKINTENAMKRVKTLQSLLPICAKCKKIRDDEG